jgi:MHS family alpha-ketoglutarate permease-like MFS transporter
MTVVTAPSARARLRVMVGVSAGNLIESFDWFVYASFALYFADSFFPKGDQTAQLLDAAAVFAGGFMARPLGAWLMGVFSDRAGRRAGLILSVSMMSLGSLGVAIIPTAKQIGVLAPALLVIIRMIQGVSLGGEYGVSAAYLTEMASRKDRGLWASSLGATPIVGQLGALCLLLVLQNSLDAKAMHDWGWRIAFAIGGALSLGILWLRRGIEETAAFNRIAVTPGASRTLAFLRQPRETAIVLGVTAGGTLGFYAFTTYLQKFLVNTSGFSKDRATQIMAAALFISVLQHPFLGALSDRIGRKPLLIAYAGLTLVLAYPLLTALSHTHSVWIAFTLVLVAVSIASCYTAVSGLYKAELFPTEIRALGIGLPYAIAGSMFGGTAEYVALSFKQHGHAGGFYIYVSVTAGLALAVALAMRETAKTSTIQDD